MGEKKYGKQPKHFTRISPRQQIIFYKVPSHYLVHNYTKIIFIWNSNVIGCFFFSGNLIPNNLVFLLKSQNI